jgi:hypothetical protein
MRGRFDVTALLHPHSATNAIAVRIIRNANPGSTKDKAGRTVNGGALGRDNPTYHASAGWDWISTIRGRDTGIWSNVSLRITGPVTVEDPLLSPPLCRCRTPLTPTSTFRPRCAISKTILFPAHSAPASARLQSKLRSRLMHLQLRLSSLRRRVLRASSRQSQALVACRLRRSQPLPGQISFVVNGNATDSKSFQAGIRQFTYSEDGGVLKMWINGRRFIARGGNWGFPESMLRYRAREYETAMRYHRDEHFNMVRNWVGQTGDDAFYDAADRNGVVIWQDFWLANPWDGPDPDNNDLFLANARDYLLRIRNHASLGLFLRTQ